MPGTETAPSGEAEDVQHKGISRAVVERAEDVLRAHLPDAVSKRIEAGLIDFISEIRVCTILFIGFPSLKVPEPKHEQLRSGCMYVILLQAHLHDALPMRIEARLIEVISEISVFTILFIGVPSLKGPKPKHVRDLAASSLA